MLFLLPNCLQVTPKQEGPVSPRHKASPTPRPTARPVTPPPTPDPVQAKSPEVNDEVDGTPITTEPAEDEPSQSTENDEPDLSKEVVV